MTYKMMSDEELWEAYKCDGDRKALNILVERYLGAVNLLSSNFTPHYASQTKRDKIYGRGLFGLLEAVDSFKPHKGNFSTWVRSIIKWRILDEVRKFEPICESLEHNMEGGAYD